MTLQKQGDFTFNHSDQQDDLYEIMTSLQVKQAFDSRANELQATLNTLIDSLQSIVDGDSGADNIGATAIADLNGTNVQTLLENLRNILKSTVDGASGADFINSTSINGVTGTTVQAQLKSLKTLIDGVFTKTDLQGTGGAGKIGTSPISGVSGITVQDMLASLKASINQTVLGQIPDGSITDVKLTDDPAGIKQQFVSHKADYIHHNGYAATTGTANAYIAILSPALLAYAEGVSLRLKINVTNTGASTVNVNSLGVKAIKTANGTDVGANSLKAGSVYTLVYNGVNFILQGEGVDPTDLIIAANGLLNS